MTSSEEVKIANPIGLHGRHLQHFLQVTSFFDKASIWLEKDNKRVNAKSMLGVMSLGIVGAVPFKIVVNCGDKETEKAIINSIIELIDCFNRTDGEIDNVLAKYSAPI